MEVKQITREIARQIREDIIALSKEAIKKEFGLDLEALGGNFNVNEYTLKLRIITPISAPVMKADDTQIRLGFAPRGTEVICGGQKFTVISARRVKYVIQDASGKQYLAAFTSCKAV